MSISVYNSISMIVRRIFSCIFTRIYYAEHIFFSLSFLLFILPYFRERTGILVWRAVVCVFARLRLCSFSSPRFYIWRHISDLEGSSLVWGLDHPDTSIPAASKMAQLIFRDQNYVSSAIHFICVYTMSIHLIYLVSDLEGSDNGDPIYGIIYWR